MARKEQTEPSTVCVITEKQRMGNSASYTFHLKPVDAKLLKILCLYEATLVFECNVSGASASCVIHTKNIQSVVTRNDHTSLMDMARILVRDIEEIPARSRRRGPVAKRAPVKKVAKQKNVIRRGRA